MVKTMYKIISLLVVLTALGMELGAQSIQDYQKSFVDEWKPRAFAGFASVTPVTQPTGSANVTVTIDTSNVRAKIPETIYGVSTTWYGGNVPTIGSDAERYYNALSSMAIRFPGGTPSDVYFWSAKTDSTFPSWYKKGSIVEKNGQVANELQAEISWAFKLSDMYALLKKNPNMNAVFQVNYSAAIYADFPTREQKVLAAAQYAAGWVKEAKDQGVNIRCWEVGNEIGRDWTPTGRNPDGSQHTVGGREFAEDFIVFAREMKKVDPTIKVGACGDDYGGFTAQCLGVPGFVDACDFLSVHDYYGAWDRSHSESDLIGQGDATEGTANKYRNIIQSAGYARDRLPLALTEWNTASVGNFATLSQGGALMHAKAIGKSIEAGYGMVNMFAMSDIWRNKGDLGMLSWGSSDGPVKQGFPAEYQYPNGTPSPIYYPYAYYRKMFGDKLVTSTCSDGGVRVYSATYSKTPVASTVLINTTNSSKVVEINGVANAQTYYYYEISPENLSDFYCTKVKVNGVGNEKNSFVGGPLKFENIPPYSGNAANGLKIDVKPYSMYFVVISTELPVLTSIKLDSIPRALMVGTPYKTNLSFLDKRGNPMYFSDSKPSYTVSGGATIDQSGVITPTAKGGPYTVTASIVGPNGTLTHSRTFKVEIPVATKISVIPSTTTLMQEDTLTFKAEVLDQNGNPMVSPTTWKTSGGGSIDNNSGLFTATTVGGPFTITATSAAISATASVTVTAGCTKYEIGDTIQAEAYCKKTAGSKEETTSDVGGGKNMGYIGTGDWFSFKVNIPADGSYKVSYRIATSNANCSIELKEGSTVLGTCDFTGTSGWQDWKTVTHTVTLKAGARLLVVNCKASGYNFNWFSLISADLMVPGIIQAEDYTTASSGLKVEACDEGGSNVGYIGAGSSLTYDVKVHTTGTYTVEFRVASNADNVKMELFSGTTSLGVHTIPTASGGWQKWATSSMDVQLTAGMQTLKFVAVTDGFNFNWMKFTCKNCQVEPSQTISLVQGWNLISLNVSPADKSIASVFSPVLSNVIEVKNSEGFYKPGATASFNSISQIVVGQAYLVNMKAIGSLTVKGTELVNPAIPTLKSGWNMVGCPFKAKTSFATAFGSSFSTIKLIKDFQNFWIQGGTSNAIDSFEPGKGYFIKK